MAFLSLGRGGRNGYDCAFLQKPRSRDAKGWGGAGGVLHLFLFFLLGFLPRSRCFTTRDDGVSSYERVAFIFLHYFCVYCNV